MTEHYKAERISIFNKLLIFFSIFIFMLIIMGMLSSVTINSCSNQRNGLLITSILQNILVFIFPSYAIIKLEKRNVVNTFGLSNKLSLINIFGIIAIMVVATPALNQIIYWNQNIVFPQCLKDIENLFRQWETQNAETTKILLDGNSLMTLLTGIFTIGIVTPIGEELFFRAGLQRILSESISRHLSIWIAAIIFSALHLQFFGFIPRVLLGAFFGYLFVWTNSIWAPIFAHAFNNTLIVILSYLTSCKICDLNFDEWGVTKQGFPWYAILSMILTAIVLFYYRKQFFYGTKNI